MRSSCRLRGTVSRPPSRRPCGTRPTRRRTPSTRRLGPLGERAGGVAGRCRQVLHVGRLQRRSACALDPTGGARLRGDRSRGWPYDLSVFANSANTFDAVPNRGRPTYSCAWTAPPSRKLFLPLAYKWVVWDYVDATGGAHRGHAHSRCRQSFDGEGATSR